MKWHVHGPCVFRPPSLLSNFRGHSGRCARAVRNVGHFGPVFPIAKVTAVTTVFPDTGLLRLLPSPKTQIMISNKRWSISKLPPGIRSAPVWCVRVVPLLTSVAHCTPPPHTHSVYPPLPMWASKGACQACHVACVTASGGDGSPIMAHKGHFASGLHSRPPRQWRPNVCAGTLMRAESSTEKYNPPPPRKTVALKKDEHHASC